MAVAQEEIEAFQRHYLDKEGFPSFDEALEKLLFPAGYKKEVYPLPEYYKRDREGGIDMLFREDLLVDRLEKGVWSPEEEELSYICFKDEEDREKFGGYTGNLSALQLEKRGTCQGVGVDFSGKNYLFNETTNGMGKGMGKGGLLGCVAGAIPVIYYTTSGTFSMEDVIPSTLLMMGGLLLGGFVGGGISHLRGKRKVKSVLEEAAGIANKYKQVLNDFKAEYGGRIFNGREALEKALRG